MLRRLFANILVTFCFLCVCALPAFADEDFDAGMQAYNERKYQDAYDCMLRVLDRNSKNADAYYVMALSCQQMGKLLEARSFYQYIVEHFPKSRAFPMASKAAKQLANVRSNPVSVAAASPASEKKRTTKINVYGRPEIEEAYEEILPQEEKIAFTREMDDKLFVMGKVNGKPQKMLIDTGAYRVIFGKKTLVKLGIKPPEGKASGFAVGAVGRVEYWETDLEISLGSIKVKMPVEVVEELEYPLLGQPFLRKMHYEIDNAHNYISFTHTDSSTRDKVPENSFVIPFRMVYSGLIVEAEVNGYPLEMNFDTGAGDCLFSLEEARRYKLKPVSSVKYGSLGGVGKGLVDAVSFDVDSIELGPIRKRNVTVSVTELGGGPYPVLGQSFFGKSRFVVDNKRRVIRFYR